MEEVMAKELMKQISGLVLEKHDDGWLWIYRKAEGGFYNTVFETFIDLTKTILAANDKLTGSDISYDED